ncbi:MAG: hypothetical protein AMJ88_11400 [Anaerolineae bacterium SM23_ 63]|nr:MAG: hypothetical protein AMJ88_11400 [Anaerolineae bacterium SM23_ 63]
MALETSIPYKGKELDLFAEVMIWKRYWKSFIREFLGSHVLEVGAGIGASIEVFADDTFSSWLGLEPDPKMVDLLKARQGRGEFPAWCDFKQGTIRDLAASDQFDAILYIDVLEHIREDVAEIEQAAKHVEMGGHIVVVAPSHQFLYSEFDSSVGHVRRYDRHSLGSLTPRDFSIVASKYLDSVGLLASLGNRFILHSPMPTRRQLWIWDKILVRLSRVVDPLLRYSFGKSIVFVWQRDL